MSRTTGLQAIFLLVLAAACSGDERAADTVAWVGESALSREELDEYFRQNLAQSTADAGWDGEGADRVRSRLLDALIDERLLLAEAERIGIRIDDDELEAELELVGGPGPSDDASAYARTRELTLRRMMVLTLQAAARDALPTPHADEIEHYAELHGERLADVLRSVRVRSLRFDQTTLASVVYDDIAAGRITFEDAAAAQQLDAVLVPVDLSWSSIPESMRPSVDALEPGEVSPPLEYGGNTYLFELISRTPETPRRDELLRLARNELQSLERADASRALLKRLRAESPVRLTDALPFRYVAPND